MEVSPFKFYTPGKSNLLSGVISWTLAPAISALLLDESYTVDLDHTMYSDLTGELLIEEVPDYYPISVTGRSITADSSNISFLCDPITWGDEVTIAARYIVLVAGSFPNLLPASPLLGYIDFGETLESVGALFGFTPADGVLINITEDLPD